LPRFYTVGSVDGYFNMVRAAIHKALDAKNPFRARLEPVRPQRPRRRVVTIPNAGGRPDLFVDGRRADRLFRDRECYVARPSALVGYEGAGEPIGEDDDPGEGA